MKILITAPTQIKGADVSPGDIREVGNNDAFTLIECRKATRDPARIAARESELASAASTVAEPAPVETATATPAAEHADAPPARKRRATAPAAQ